MQSHNLPGIPWSSPSHVMNSSALCCCFSQFGHSFANDALGHILSFIFAIHTHWTNAKSHVSVKCEGASCEKERLSALVWFCILWKLMRYFLNTKDDSIRKLVLGEIISACGKTETEWMMLISLWQVPVSCPPILIMWELVRRNLLWKADTESTCTWGRPTSSWNVFPPWLSTCFCTFLFLPFSSSSFSLFWQTGSLSESKVSGCLANELKEHTYHCPFPDYG